MLRVLFAFLMAAGLALPALAQNTPQDMWRDELAALSFMEGEYDVLGESIDAEGVWHQGEATTASFTFDLDGAGLVEDATYATPRFSYGLYALYGYDGFRETYRVMLVDSVYGLPDVYEGQMEDGALVMSNVGLGTHFPLQNAGAMHFRIIFTDTPTGLASRIDYTVDDGENWVPMYRYTFTAR